MNNEQCCSFRHTVAFDFDGVIHRYLSGWTGIDKISDGPVDGIKNVIDQLNNIGWEVVVYSTRCKSKEGVAAIKEWLKNNDIHVYDVVEHKPPAIVYVDDRAICFDGNTKNLFNRIINFRQWQSRRKENRTLLFFDTEFTGLNKDTTLISIGIIAENGLKFYAEFTDYDEDQCNDWLRENVLDNTILAGNETIAAKYGEDPDTTVVLGDFFSIRKELRLWMDQFDIVQFVSDVPHYDMVLLIDLLCDCALDLPKSVSSVCYDINQDIARYYSISDGEAFDKNREEIVSEFGIEIAGEKHNSLYDAMVIKTIYECVNI